jgi:death-on-curing protein
MSGGLPETIQFVGMDDLLAIHRVAIEDQQGDAGIRDRGALESALAQPKQQFGGQYVYESLAAMAAAYAFHISRNHPFMDRNKRASLAAMLIFLLDNDLRLTASEADVYETIYNLAAGSVTKDALIRWVEAHCSRSADE